MKYKYKLSQSFFRIIKSIPISHLLPGWRSASPLYSKVNVDFSVNQRLMGSLVNFLSCFPFFSLFFSSPALWLEKKCNSESPFSCFLLCSLKGSVGKNAEPLTINSKALQPNPVKSGLRPGEGGKGGGVCWAPASCLQKDTDFLKSVQPLDVSLRILWLIARCGDMHRILGELGMFLLRSIPTLQKSRGAAGGTMLLGYGCCL